MTLEGELRNRAQGYLESDTPDRFEKERECYDRLLEIDGSDVVALRGKGLSFLSEITYMEDVMKEPHDPDPSSENAAREYAKECINNALLCFDKALKIDPTDNEALEGRAIAIRRRG